MKLSDDQTDSVSLSALGSEAVRLIKDARFEELANRFGYALAFGEEPATAIEDEIVRCLSGDGRAATLANAASARISVKYFKPGESFFFALVECFMPLMQDAGEILVELIVTSKGQEKYVCLEQISYAA